MKQITSSRPSFRGAAQAANPESSNRRRRAFARAVVAALFLLDRCASVALAADADLVAAAKQEGEVVWYTTQIVNQFSRPAAEAFQRRYGVRVNYVRGDSVELAARLLN